MTRQENGKEADRRSAARRSADMESRALAEYARCRRPERLNLALRRNIPVAARCVAASTQKGFKKKAPPKRGQA
ncbi:hypothetical protein BMW22_06460 [Rhizobium leguminosarum]|uniref:Uncharacterized protein n=1 Tax=Rhizobium leguminosarum TaxID=384 RepID=A0A1L3Z704_RHILE|nr:hypothetical protein BMW22_06460 [Rhizobium leguminosarum]